MKQRSTVWQFIIVIICLVGIVTITAYNPSYPKYPEASVYGAEDNGALLITKVLPRMGVTSKIVTTNIDSWDPASTVCIIEPVVDLSLSKPSFDLPKLKTWVKQGGKLVIFGSGKTLSESNPSLFAALYTEKPLDNEKRVKLPTLFDEDYIFIKNQKNSSSEISFTLPQPNVSDINKNSINPYTAQVKQLMFPSIPSVIINPYKNKLKTYISLESINRDWKYLIGELTFGNGKVLFVTSAQLIYNKPLLQADNAQFVYNVLSNGTQSVSFVDLNDDGSNNQVAIFRTIFFNPWGRLVIIGFFLFFVLQLDRIIYFAKPLPEPKVQRRSIMDYINAQGWTYYRARANTLAYQALVDGIKRKFLISYQLPAIPSLQFIKRKITELGNNQPQLQPACQTVITIIERAENTKMMTSNELKQFVNLMQLIEPYLYRRQKN